MRLFLLSQGVNRGYETFDSCVVCAEDESDAKTIHPAGDGSYIENDYAWKTLRSWADNPGQVRCLYLGEADPTISRGVVCSSYRNG